MDFKYGNLIRRILHGLIRACMVWVQLHSRLHFSRAVSSFPPTARDNFFARLTDLAGKEGVLVVHSTFRWNGYQCFSRQLILSSWSDTPPLLSPFCWKIVLSYIGRKNSSPPLRLKAGKGTSPGTSLDRGCKFTYLHGQVNSFGEDFSEYKTYHDSFYNFLFPQIRSDNIKT